eukprot:979428-Ditylum_brightwellii.AAC.1
MMLGKGLLYESLPDTLTLTSTTIIKKDMCCLWKGGYLTCGIINIATKKLEKLSPHKSARQFIPMYVTGFDNTYEGGQDGWEKYTLFKHLTSEHVGVMKGLKKFMVGVNPKQVHWQALLIDAENTKIYSHYSLGTIASNVEK